MKQCPQCQRIFDDSWFACEDDNKELIEVKDAPAGKAIAPQKAILYAGLWRRFMANALDSILITMISLLLIVTSGSGRLIGGSLHKSLNVWGQFTIIAVYISFFFFYDAYCIYRWGQTLGKKIVGIKVTNYDQLPVTFSKSFLRIFLYRVFYNLGIFFGVGTILYAISAFMASGDNEKRTWHDRICKTVVIKL